MFQEIFKINVLVNFILIANFKQNNKLEAESLVLHEANPGHHYQTIYVIESRNIPIIFKK